MAVPKKYGFGAYQQNDDTRYSRTGTAPKFSGPTSRYPSFPSPLPPTSSPANRGGFFRNKWLLIGGGIGGVVVVAIVVVALLFIGGGGGGSAGVSDLLKMVPEDAVMVSIADTISVRQDVDFEEALDITSPADTIDIEEVDEYILVILETGAEVHLLKGTFQFDDLRDDLEEQGHEEDSYREYEVWYGQRNYALFEDDGYVIVSRNKDATEEVLKTLYRGSGSLADAENDNELKRILDKLGNAPVVLAVVGDSCTVKRCQGYGMAAISYDIGEEELSSELVVLFSSERAAEDAADDYDDVADFIEQTMDLDVADTTSDGEFVLGTGTESYAPPTPTPTTAPPPTEAPAATEATATTAPPPTEAPAREVPTAGPTATPEPTEIANMSNLDIARDIVECGIDDDRDDDILDITSSQPGVGERQAAIKMEEMYSRRDLIDYYYDFCE